jgi:hypothetical protein
MQADDRLSELQEYGDIGAFYLARATFIISLATKERFREVGKPRFADRLSSANMGRFSGKRRRQGIGTRRTVIRNTSRRVT